MDSLAFCQRVRESAAKSALQNAGAAIGPDESEDAYQNWQAFENGGCAKSDGSAKFATMTAAPK